MSLKRKPLGGEIRWHRPKLEAGEDGASSTTQDAVGPYGLLLAEYHALLRSADKVTLVHTAAGEGRLTVTRESPVEDPVGTAEVEWVELRKKIETHPRYAEVTDDDMRAVRAAVADPESGEPDVGARALELYKKLLRGQTEYSIGSPVARLTTPLAKDDLTAGGTWFREAPPFAHPDGYEWMKTVDQRRKTGRQYDRVEEWTGAEDWDADIYTTP